MLNLAEINYINDRYSKRVKEFGYSPKSLGWSDKVQQDIRFSRLCNDFDFNQKKIVDLGCGFGDFYKYLLSSGYSPSKYTGIDINEDLIKIAIKNNSNANFYVSNILNETDDLLRSKYKCDVCISIGMFNLNFANDKKRMYDFMNKILDRMLILSSDAIIFDFIPTIRIDNYQKENYIMTYSFDFIADYMAKNNLAYKINCTQKANPMVEALVTIFK